MDELYESEGITFAWDSDRARMNRSKHRVSFEQAAEAFFDPFLRVVHLVVEEQRMRIISARRATTHERRIYEN